MKKILIISLLFIPVIAFARGGGSTSSFRSSSSSYRPAPVSSFRSTPAPVYTPRTYSSKTYTPSTQSFLPNYLLFYVLFMNQNNHNWKESDAFETRTHFPYVVIKNKTTKDYLVARYIGANDKTEKISQQEQQGLTWLNEEIKF